MTELPVGITVDPETARREVAFAYHDHQCENGPTCPDRKEAPEAYDQIMPGLIAVANVATQLALLHLTVRFDLSPEDAVNYGVYSSVDWASMLTAEFGCTATFTLDNGDTRECTEKGAHPIHKASYMGAPIVWEDLPPEPDDPDTPEEAAEVVQLRAAWDEAKLENAARDKQERIDNEKRYLAELQQATEEAT